MFVRAPRSERRQILDDPRARRMKDVRAVQVDADTALIKRIVGVPRDMRSRVDDQDGGVELARKPFGDGRSGEARPDDQVIVDQSTECIPKGFVRPPRSFAWRRRRRSSPGSPAKTVRIWPSSCWRRATA